MYKSYLEHSNINWELNTTIDRINNELGYSKENCRWATIKQQANNTSRNNYITYKWITKTLAQWAEKIWINQSTLRMRLSTYKWPLEKAFNYLEI